MKDYIIFNLFAFVCGIAGSCLGAIFTVFLPDGRTKIFQVLLGFTAGLMLGLITFGLIPEAVEFSNLFFCLCVLILSCFLIDKLQFVIDKRLRYSSGYIRSGFMISLAIALHNFPEGLAIGSSFVYDKKFGLLVGLMILIHDIPEGFALAVPFRMAQKGVFLILFYAFLAGLPTGIGCIAGSIVGSVNRFLLSSCISFAAGAMLYVVMNEIIPEYSRAKEYRLSSAASIFGMIFSLLLLEWL